MPLPFLIASIACHRPKPCAAAACVSASNLDRPPSNSMIAARSSKASRSMDNFPPHELIEDPRRAVRENTLLAVARIGRLVDGFAR